MTSVRAFRLLAAPRIQRSATGLIDVLSCVWPSLREDDAIECRTLSVAGLVDVYLVTASSRPTRSAAARAADELAGTLEGLLISMLPEWSWERVAKRGASRRLMPFHPKEGGDLLRREIEVTLADGALDVSRIALPEVLRGLGPLASTLAATPFGVLLTVTAQPAHLDEQERLLLNNELRQLLDGRFSSATSPLELELAKEAYTKRLASPGGLGQLRISLASEGPLPPELVALASAALGAAPGALRFARAETDAEKDTFLSNLTQLGFKLWGPFAEREPERARISDSYLASIEEILAAWRVPQPDGFTPLSAELRDPAPRPVALAVPHQGLIVGESHYRSERRPVALSDADRARHMYVVGQTGAGKSTLLLNMITQDIEAGMGVALIDPHGDLVDDVIARFPRTRADDLILIDPSDGERPVALNILESGEEAQHDFLIQSMLEMLYRVYDPNHSGIMGPRFEHWFRNGALTVLASPDGGSLVDIPKVFTDDTYLARLLQFVTDPAVRSFWIDELGQTSDYHKSEMLGWFVGKFGAFLTNRVMRDIVGQRRSSFDMREAMDDGKVVLVRLSKGLLGDINLRWLGMIAITKIQLAAMSRADSPVAKRRPFALYVDEFQNFSLGSFDQIISEARKYGLWLTMAHQHVGQLPDEFREAVFGNVGAIAAFRVGANDAELIADEMAGYGPRDLTRIENYRCVLRLAVGGRVQPPFDVYTRSCPPNGDESVADAVRQLSRLKYGRPAEIVEEEVMAAYRRR